MLLLVPQNLARCQEVAGLVLLPEPAAKKRSYLPSIHALQQTLQQLLGSPSVQEQLSSPGAEPFDAIPLRYPQEHISCQQSA
jgi:hypothetical protein